MSEIPVENRHDWNHYVPVSNDGNEFGMLKKKKTFESPFSKYQLVRLKDLLLPVCWMLVRLCTA